MVQPKGKQGTKGQRQILVENVNTLVFYGAMALISLIVHVLFMCAMFWEHYTFKYALLTLLTVTIYFLCLQFLLYMARPTYSETGQLLDGGLDLNIESGISEHLKDMIILTSTTLLLSLISSYFWFLLLLAPIRACYVIWVSLLQPWIFEPGPEIDEKKQKKLDRKARRQQ